MDNETVYILTKSVFKCITKYEEGEGGGVSFLDSPPMYQMKMS